MSRLTTGVLNNIIKNKVRYLPGWTIKVEEDEFEGQYLVIRADVPDAYHPEQTMTLNIVSHFPPMFDSGNFFDFLSWRLRQIAIHESMEWFRVNGKPWVDPHALGEQRGH